jgi:predicted Na+-dependent transporter
LLFIGVIFNTWFFLAGIPLDLEEIDKEVKYEKVIKLFAQFVLIPVTSIYLLILYAYEIKILFDWELPNGWVY